MNPDHYIQKYLKTDIRLHTEEDDTDLPVLWIDAFFEPMVREKGINLYREFSAGNQYALLHEFMQVRDEAKVIVEIGVARLSTNLYEHTSTSVLLHHKKRDTLYLGIDAEDRSFIDDPDMNIHTVQCYSQDYSKVVSKMQELGIEKIDFLFVDGWHSINQVIAELFYVDLLRPGGIVGYHDINYHRGPHRMIHNLKPNLFDVRMHCLESTDWGVGFATLKTFHS